MELLDAESPSVTRKQLGQLRGSHIFFFIPTHRFELLAGTMYMYGALKNASRISDKVPRRPKVYHFFREQAVFNDRHTCCEKLNCTTQLLNVAFTIEQTVTKNTQEHRHRHGRVMLSNQSYVLSFMTDPKAFGPSTRRRFISTAPLRASASSIFSTRSIPLLDPARRPHQSVLFGS